MAQYWGIIKTQIAFPQMKESVTSNIFWDSINRIWGKYLKKDNINQDWIHFTSRHGPWTPRESFFRKSHTFGLGQTNWTENLGGIWGIFGQSISTHFGTVSPLSMFSLIQPLFLQKLSLYIDIPYFFGIEDLNLGRTELGT